MGSVTHTFQSAIADDPAAQAAGEVLPSHWNAAHDVSSLAIGDVPSISTALSTSLSTTTSSITSLSTSTSTGLNSLSTSASTGINSLSTSCSSGLSTATSSITSLSTSTSTGINSLSTSTSSGLSTVSSSVTSLSTSTSSGISSLSTSTSTGINSLSTSTSTAIAGVSAGSGTKTYLRWGPLDNHPPSANYATLDTRNSLACLDFDDTTAEGAVFIGIMPEAASLGSGLVVYLTWAATSATTGNTIWEVSFARLNANNQDLDSYAFDTVTTSSASAANGTNGKTTTPSISVAAADTDGIAAGEMFALKVRRLPANASDDMVGDAELYAVEVRGA